MSIVFPAYAGMSPPLGFGAIFLDCFPRIRGDEPAQASSTVTKCKFSPHTRG